MLAKVYLLCLLVALVQLKPIYKKDIEQEGHFHEDKLIQKGLLDIIYVRQHNLKADAFTQVLQYLREQKWKNRQLATESEDFLHEHLYSYNRFG